jgi:two-component system sensor histidine kinase HydH
VHNIFTIFRSILQKFRTLPLPVVSILSTVLTLLILLAISTYRNYDRERQRMEEFLFQQGVNIIHGLEAGARAGMMHRLWQENHLEALVEEVARSADLARVTIIGADGRVLADSKPQDVGEQIVPDLVPLGKILADFKARGWRRGDIYIVAKRFVPIGGMGMMRRGILHGRSSAAPPRVAVVEMMLKPYLEAQRADVRHALLMALLLLVLGSASFYFIFVVQNLHLVRRTLRSMTSYVGHVVEHMPDGLVSVNAEGEVLRINGRARTLLHLPQDAVGQDVDQLDPRLGTVFREAAAGKRVLEREISWTVSEDSTLPLAVSASRVTGKDGEDLGVVILLRDLQEVKALRAQVQRSERLAALGQLAAGVAHEIRNPLSSIRGFAQFFQKRLPAESEERGYAEVMVHEVDRLNRVINNLLDFAGPKEPVLREIHPRALVEHAVALLAREAETRGIRIDLQGETPAVSMDPDQMTQAVLNLLLNAMEAMTEGGTIRVTIETDRAGRGWVLAVEDSGPGIPTADLEQLFNPFFTTKKRGTGLGLAIVHRIVENHGGTIEVESRPGGGSRFVLRFPETVAIPVDHEDGVRRE